MERGHAPHPAAASSGTPGRRRPQELSVFCARGPTCEKCLSWRRPSSARVVGTSGPVPIRWIAPFAAEVSVYSVPFSSKPISEAQHLDRRLDRAHAYSTSPEDNAPLACVRLQALVTCSPCRRKPPDVDAPGLVAVGERVKTRWFSLPPILANSSGASLQVPSNPLRRPCMRSWTQHTPCALFNGISKIGTILSDVIKDGDHASDLGSAPLVDYLSIADDIASQRVAHKLAVLHAQHRFHTLGVMFMCDVHSRIRLKYLTCFCSLACTGSAQRAPF